MDRSERDIKRDIENREALELAGRIKSFCSKTTCYDCIFNKESVGCKLQIMPYQWDVIQVNR